MIHLNLFIYRTITGNYNHPIIRVRFGGVAAGGKGMIDIEPC